MTSSEAVIALPSPTFERVRHWLAPDTDGLDERSHTLHDDYSYEEEECSVMKGHYGQ
jgi:hypothetical protein